MNRIVGRSEAGKRIEEAGRAFEKTQSDVWLVEKGALLLAALSERLEKAGNQIIEDLDAMKRQVVGRRAPIHLIIEDVAKKHGLTFDELVSDRRSRPVVEARHEAMYRCLTETPYSLPRIAAVFRRDHTTLGNGAMRHAFLNDKPLPRSMTRRAYSRSRAEGKR